MFQRFKTAIDRTIAEEQARQSEQRTLSPSANRQRSLSRSNSARDSPAKRRTKRPGSDAANGDNVANTDPAVFEAAFALDEEEAEAKAIAEKPANPEKSGAAEGTDAKKGSTDGDNQAKGQTDDDASTLVNEKIGKESAPARAELSPEIQARLRKLDKLEKTYPELLRSYRIAHGRATSIEPFERALRENTPLTTIKDPDAFNEYLQQMTLRTDMVMGELKRVAAEKESFKKQAEDSDKKIATLQEQLTALQAAKAEETAQTNKGETAAAISASADKQPSAKPSQNEEVAEDMFSYEDEIPQLQAELNSKAQEITKLKSDIGNLQDELAVAKENSTGLVENLEKATRELSEARDTTAVQTLQAQLDARESEFQGLKQRLEETEIKNTSTVQALQAELDARESEVQSFKQKLEKAEAGDTSVGQTLRDQLEARASELESLKQKLAKAETQMRDVESRLEKEKASTVKMTKEHQETLKAANDEMTKAQSPIRDAQKKIEALSLEIDSLKKAKTEDLDKISQLNKQLQNVPASPVTTAPADKAETPATPAAPGGPKKKNNKKKKKGGAAATAGSVTSESTAVESVPATPTIAHVEAPGASELREEITKLKNEIAEKDTRIENLSKQRKTEEDLREEVETLQETLMSIGHDHTETKEKIKELQAEKVALKERIQELEAEVTSITSKAESGTKAQSELVALKNEYEELKTKTSTLTSELGAAKKLSQSRFREIADLKEVLSKAQPELKSLRQKTDTLETTKEELASRQTDIKNLEKKERELQGEVTRLQRALGEREGEVRMLNERIAAEAKTRAKLEDEKRVAGRDFRRSEADKIELSSKHEKAVRELGAVQSELSHVKPKIKALEEELEKMKKEQDGLKQEAELKTAQYNKAQGLLASMQDQAVELTTQLRESRSHAESLEEELAEAQKHVQERSRESHKMRLMMNDNDARADEKIRDMRAQMEVAIEERERVEFEAATVGRSKAREAEEFKSKNRELEKSVKTLSSEKEKLEAAVTERRLRLEELEESERKALAEVEDARSTVSSLQSALDNLEKQGRDAEKQVADLRKQLNDGNTRYEALQKDYETAQARLTGAGAANSRSSVAGSQPDELINREMIKATLYGTLTNVKGDQNLNHMIGTLGRILHFTQEEQKNWDRVLKARR